MKFALTIASIAVLFAGCAADPVQLPKPGWIDGDSASYQSTQYLVGRGMAATRQEAEDRARADLAKIFEVKVTVDSEDTQSFETGSAKTEQGGYEGQASRRISTHTDQIISGIQIAELWQDPVTQYFHALAILSRLQATSRLRQQISGLDEATQTYIELARKNSDLFHKIAAASQAVDAQGERQALQKSLQIVDSSGIGTQPRWNMAQLNSDLDELLRRAKIALQASADSPPGLKDVVAGALAQAGFMIDTGQQPDFILKASMDLHDLGLQDGWYWQRGDLEVVLTEGESGRVRGSKRWVIKSSAQDRKISVNRAMNQADIALKQDLRKVMLEMISYSGSQGQP